MSSNFLKKLHEQPLYQEALKVLSPDETRRVNDYAASLFSSIEEIMNSLQGSMAHTGSAPLVMTDSVASGSIG